MLLCPCMRREDCDAWNKLCYHGKHQLERSLTMSRLANTAVVT